MKMGIGGQTVGTGLHWLRPRLGVEDESSLSAGQGLDRRQPRIKNFGAHPRKLDRDRDLLTAAKGVGDFANPETGVDDLIADLPAAARRWASLTATHSIGRG